MSEKYDRIARQLVPEIVSMAVVIKRHPQDLLWELCYASGLSPEDAREMYLSGQKCLLGIQKTIPFVID